MNSDPHDSAAWRTFGMLDADESAIFDEAMRHDPALRSAFLEMDRLSAAIGAASVAPIEPRPGQLERLQNRLGLYPVKRSHFWLGISGWAAAAVLALLLVFSRENTSSAHQEVAGKSSIRENPLPAGKPAQPSRSPVPKASAEKPTELAAADQDPDSDAAVLAAAQELAKAKVRVETKRLVQEIEVLRENLEKLQQQDRVLFEAVPGVAVPIIMTMRPPGLKSDGEITIAQNDPEESITGMLGDALKMVDGEKPGPSEGSPVDLLATAEEKNPGNPQEIAAAPALSESIDSASNETTGLPPLAAAETALPSAVPIYDAARGSGTLVVKNLPDAGEGNVYNLWMHTLDGESAIYVGSLPEGSNSTTDSFDFTLGSTKVLPAGFVLTKDGQDNPEPPSTENTVLEGPTPAEK